MTIAREVSGASAKPRLLASIRASGRSAARTLADAERLGIPVSIVATRTNLAFALANLGRLEEARAASALAIRAPCRDRLTDGEARINHARVVFAEALDANGEHAAARSALAAARDELLRMASKIPEARWRESFLARVPENARTLALAERWLGS
jgi:eukaryotic-like serine/threonine-protein kinase